MPAGEAMDNLRHFHEQDEDWRAAEQDIIAAREANPRTRPPGTVQLAAAASYKVAAVNAAWQGDWARAIDAAGQALGKLAGGDEIRTTRPCGITSSAPGRSSQPGRGSAAPAGGR
jgi:hypothetical protein